mmetsp:Transcript_3195/g.7289  ORF Transcript_3195/g.7289 Transcript_3195/m.7289 type:complete len:383 (-) Transcript_3195:714-1862(-)
MERAGEEGDAIVAMLGPDESSLSNLRGRQVGPLALGRVGHVQDGLDEDDGIVHVGADGLGAAMPERLGVVLLKIDGHAGPRIGGKVIPPEQLGRAAGGAIGGRRHIPHPILAPDAVLASALPGTHIRWVESPPSSVHHERREVVDGAGKSGPEQYAGPHVASPPDEVDVGRYVRGILRSHEADAGFVQDVESQHVGLIPNGLRHPAQHGAVVPLEIVLRGFALHHGAGRKVIPGEEEGPHRPGPAAHIVGIPRHRHGLLRRGEVGGPAVAQLGEIDPDRLQRPARRPVPAGEARPGVLMAVEEDRHAVLMTFADDRHQVVEIFLVIDARTGVLDRLPGEEEAERRVSPADEAGEVDVGLGEGEGPADEGDVAMIGEEGVVIR